MARLRIAFTFADVTVEALLDRQEDGAALGARDALVSDVQHRAQLFQAQGMVMVQLDVSISEAMIRMRAAAYAQNRRLDDIARDVVGRILRFDRDQT
jgi:AmiR/NasT family two-component response regulator